MPVHDQRCTQHGDGQKGRKKVRRGRQRGRLTCEQGHDVSLRLIPPKSVLKNPASRGRYALLTLSLFLLPRLFDRSMQPRRGAMGHLRDDAPPPLIPSRGGAVTEGTASPALARQVAPRRPVGPLSVQTSSTANDLRVHDEIKRLAVDTKARLVASRQPQALLSTGTTTTTASASHRSPASSDVGQVLAALGLAGAPALSEHSRRQMELEQHAATEAVAEGVYWVWRNPSESGRRVAGAHPQLGNECCRIASSARCFCGHTSGRHRYGDRRRPPPQAPPPPPCLDCGCASFAYVPNTPLEVGDHFLMRRKDFDPLTWSPKCRCGHTPAQHGGKYRKCQACPRCFAFEGAFLCVACDGRWEDHETVLMAEAERRAVGLPVGMAYMPLVDHPELRRVVFDRQQPASRRLAARGEH